jgi:hypothetical protein
MMNEPDFTSYDYVIGGKLVVGRAVLEDTFAEILGRDVNAAKRVKEKLANDIATFMLENQLLEFTQFKDPIDYKTHIAVRAYIAPNDQVKLLRMANKIV